MSFKKKAYPVALFTKDGSIGAVWADFPDEPPLVRLSPPPYDSVLALDSEERAVMIVTEVLGIEVNRKKRTKNEPITIKGRA